MRRGSRIWRILTVLMVMATAVMLGAVVYAPYLPRLLTERYPEPRWPTAGAFATVTGVSSAPLKSASRSRSRALDPKARQLFSERSGRALLVYQGGKLELEHYADGVDEGTRFNSYSMVKSLVGALVLRAHAEGRIAKLEDPISAYLPGLGDDEFGRTPILSILRMRSGVIFEADEAKSAFGQGAKDIENMRMNPFGPMARLHMLGLENIAKKLRVQSEDRGRYKYQNVNTSILGRLLEQVYGKPLEVLLAEKIWMPARAKSSYWRRHDRRAPVTAYCCLYATPMDWVRVGVFLMTNGGKHGPFLPEKLWRRYLGQDLAYQDVRKGRYGLHLYQNVLDRSGEKLQGTFSYMFGSRGQVVYLMPKNDLVVVRFGEQIQLLHSTLYSAWNTVHTD